MINIKDTSIDALYMGNEEITKVYLGTDLVYGGGGGHDYSQDYLTFTALEDGTFKFSNPLEYSIDDGNTWTALAANTATPTIPADSKILWKATGLTPTSSAGIGTFSSTGRFEAEGNVMTLRDGTTGGTALSNYQFLNLFNGATGLISAENLVLPATTLVQYCYQYMFSGCTSLTTAPELPVTTLANYCYYGMFYGCTSLTTAPELPATTLAQGCYRNIFSYCTSLNSVTCLATDISATSCTKNWLSGVSASGTFTKAASMSNWTTGANGIPNGWTVQDFQ